MPRSGQYSANVVLEPEQKALEINLDTTVYGSFAEIGAGQEVARYFFQAGGAAGTIAKSMSAYDKTVSDRIYGTEEKGRYVCEARVYKMLDHEYELVVERLMPERPNTRFFAFADTVAAINFHRTIKGNGWLGMRFQLEPGGGANDIVLHVHMHDKDNQQQQQAVGILGVNLIYACFYYHRNMEVFVRSLTDNLKGRVSIDLLRVSGPDFRRVDNRQVALSLVRNGISDVVMFGPDGRQLHASEMLYRKSVLVVRGSFHPPTLVNEDMLRTATRQFCAEPDVQPDAVRVLTEITLDNLQAHGDLDEQDFLERATVLGTMGQTVLITNCEEHHKLVNYLNEYKIGHLGLVIGIRELQALMTGQYEKHRDGSLLAAFGELFMRNVRLYVYPCRDENGEMLHSGNIALPQEIRYLYRHLIENREIADLSGYNPDILGIFSRTVLEMIRADRGNWAEMVSPAVAEIIRSRGLFGFPTRKMEFEY